MLKPDLLMEETANISLNEIDQKVLKILDSVETEAKSSKHYHKIGINTEFAKAIKELSQSPFSYYDKLLSEHLTRIADGFIFVLLETIKQKDLLKTLDSFAYELNGSHLSLWIFLKTHHWTFDVRSKLYEIVYEMKNSKYFGSIELDFLILQEGDTSIPTGYKSITKF